MNQEERTVLIASGISQIKFALARVIGKLPSNIERDDLVSEGLLCIMNNLDRWDESHVSGASFATFIYPKILGSMRDFVRRHAIINRRYLPIFPDVECYCSDRGQAADATKVSTEMSTLKVCSLSREEQIILELHFVRGYTQKVIANKLKISEAYLCIKVGRAVEKMRRVNKIVVGVNSNGNGNNGQH